MKESKYLKKCMKNERKKENILNEECKMPQI